MGVRIRKNKDNTQWIVETLEEENDGSPSNSAREWGAHSLFDCALAFCYGAFIGKPDTMVWGLKEIT